MAKTHLSDRRKKKLVSNLTALQDSVAQLKILIERGTQKHLNSDLEAREINVMEDYDKVGRLIDPEHSHYEDAT